MNEIPLISTTVLSSELPLLRMIAASPLPPPKILSMMNKVMNNICKIASTTRGGEDEGRKKEGKK